MRVVLAVFVLACAAAPALRAHDLVARNGVNGLRTSFVVEAAPAAVLDALWDVQAFREVFPEIERVTVNKVEGNSLEATFAIDLGLVEVEYTLRRVRASDAITWRCIGGDVKSIEGAWRVAPHPRGALVTYESYVDLGWAVPSSVARDLALKKADALPGRVQNVVERRKKKAASHTP